VFASEATGLSELNSELKRKGVTYAQLVEKLKAIEISEREVNVANKLFMGKFSATFILACLSGVGSSQLHLG
jgi:hypothetical protein